MSTALRNPTLRAVRGPVALSAEVRGAQKGFFSEIVNMSGSGALLKTDAKLAVGDVVMMRFSVPGHADVQTEARVARVEGKTKGVAFTDISEHASELVVRHVLRHGRPTA